MRVSGAGSRLRIDGNTVGRITDAPGDYLVSAVHAMLGVSSDGGGLDATAGGFVSFSRNALTEATVEAAGFSNFGISFARCVFIYFSSNGGKISAIGGGSQVWVAGNTLTATAAGEATVVYMSATSGLAATASTIEALRETFGYGGRQLSFRSTQCVPCACERRLSYK